MFFIILNLLLPTRSQPCVTPIKLLQSPLTASCDTSAPSPLSFILDTLTLGTEFTLAGWFTLDVKGTTEYSLFRVTMDEGDTAGSTKEGIRAAILIHDEILDLKYSTTATQTLSKPFPYTIRRWFFAAVSLSYSAGRLNHYVWQPQTDLRIVNAPLALAVNFNSPLTNTAIVNLLYWGPYQTYCGRIDKVYFYPGYYEPDNTLNWINIAFLEESLVLDHLFRLEDQVGQNVKGAGTSNGFLGQNKGIDIYDPAPGYFLTFSSQQYVTLPLIKMSKSHFSIKFWLWLSPTITADADLIDTQKDIVIFRRVQQGSTDILSILVSQPTANYAIRLKIENKLYALAPAIAPTTWTFVSISLAYPASINGVTKLYYHAVVGATQVPLTLTDSSSTYAETDDDRLFLGDSRNTYTGTYRMANFHLVPSFVSYNAASLKCLTNCQNSINSFTQKYCKKCPNFEQNGSCVAACATGTTGVQSATFPMCVRCSYQCSKCLAAACTECNSGYYLQASSCVIASACNVGFLADPNSKTCTQCGNGVQNGAETCDDGNFIQNDGCTNCAVDSGFSCSAYPSVCVKKCGNGVVDAPEGCDSGGSYKPGCLNCVIESGYQCVGGPSVCSLLCGNGKKVNEDCDDGNITDGDGCSKCLIDAGYQCSGGSPTSSDSCSKLCPNGTINQGEFCDDNNNTQGDGCHECHIEIGWTCTNAGCAKDCGNKIIDGVEECDDGNQSPGDGCYNCRIEHGFKCPTGTSCEIVLQDCGDGYLSPSEECEDSNQVGGDGCSSICKVESGYRCLAGPYIYSPTSCSPICGNGLITAPEECDDSNTIKGDGCSDKCRLEYVCGDGIREGQEECDDGNTFDLDGCSNCRKDPGFYCDIIVGGKTDLCIECGPNCHTCDQMGNCERCHGGYVLYDKECYTGCPIGFYADLENRNSCQTCSKNCLECAGEVCLQCSLTTYLFNEKCLTQCADGYFNQPNAVLGNSCVQCFLPCIKCSSATKCMECDEFYRIEKDQCTQCNMGEQCIHCEADRCLECIVGYEPSGKECKLIEPNCGDGRHALSEQCDDAGASGGCVGCTIQSGYHCVLEDNRGPDICFKLEPFEVTTSIDKVHFDTLFIHFSRPLLKWVNFTELLYINIPTQPDYKFEFTLKTMSLLEAKFIFYETVQNTDCFLNFSSPNLVVDKFGYSLVGLANASTSEIAQFGLIKARLNYFIHYSEDERAFADTLAYIGLSFICLSLLTSFLYSAKIGAGLVWQLLFSLQIISLMRLVNLRYSLHVYRLLDVLNYTNLSFIPNIFEFVFEAGEQTSFPKFLIANYPQEFLMNGGGRFISLLGYSIIFWCLNKGLVQLVTWEPILNRLEEINDYMRFQYFIRLLEVMFLDLMVSLVQSIQVYGDGLKIASNVIALLIFLGIFALFAAFFQKVVQNNDAVKLEWLHLHFQAVYDGIDLRQKLARLWIYAPYFSKLIYSIVFVVDNPIIQISIICTFRVIIYLPAIKVNLFISKTLLVRQVYQGFVDVGCIAIFLIYLNENDPKLAKVGNGWIIFMGTLINIWQFAIWNAILIFLQFKGPDYLVEEFEADQKQLDEKFQESKKNRFEQQYGKKKDVKVNQIVPVGSDYDQKEPISSEEHPETKKAESPDKQGSRKIKQEEVKKPQIAPEGYQAPLKVSSSQVVPLPPAPQDRPKSAQIEDEDDDDVRQRLKKKMEQAKEKKQTEQQKDEQKKQKDEEQEKLMNDFFG